MRFKEFVEAWVEKKLGDLLEFKNGINASKEQYGKGVKFINVLDILNNDFITYDNIAGRVDIDDTTLEKYPVKYGDILFQRSSETREEVGTANVYLDKEKTATFGGFVIRGRKIGNYDPIFFNKLLKTNAARDSITSKSGGSTRYNVGQEILTSVILHFPSLCEQEKIAAFLTLIDDRITTQNKIITQLESLIKGLRENLFTCKWRFKNDGVNNFPDWKIKKLSEVYSFKMTNSFSREQLNYENGNVKNIHYGDIHTKFKTLFDITKEIVPFINARASIGKILEDNYCKEGDVIFADASEDLNDVGKSMEIVKLNGEKVLSGLHTILARPDLTKMCIGFGGYLFQSGSVRLQIQKESQGTKVLSISANRLSNIKICLPCVEEQKCIVNFLSILDGKIEAEKRILQQYETQKKYLLQNLFI